MLYAIIIILIFVLLVLLELTIKPRFDTIIDESGNSKIIVWFTNNNNNKRDWIYIEDIFKF